MEHVLLTHLQPPKRIYSQLLHSHPTSPNFPTHAALQPSFLSSFLTQSIHHRKMLLPSLATIAILLIGTQARYIKRSNGITIRSSYPIARQAPSEIVRSTVTLPLRKIRSSQGSTTHRAALYGPITVPNGTTTSVAALSGGFELSVQVVLGDSMVELLVDTGSSDTVSSSFLSLFSPVPLLDIAVLGPSKECFHLSPVLAVLCFLPDMYIKIINLFL